MASNKGKELQTKMVLGNHTNQPLSTLFICSTTDGHHRTILSVCLYIRFRQNPLSKMILCNAWAGMGTP
jgi:hypothetical protein